MPSKQSKKIFVGGLDKDTDLRALKNGDYHHALNIRNISSEANTEGVVENIKGNKKVAYDFPTPPQQGKRRICLFMPWTNYWFNYGGVGYADSDLATNIEGFDGHLRDENDPNTYTTWESAYDEDGYPLGYGYEVEVTNYPFPAYYAQQYGPGDNPGEDGPASSTYTDLGEPSITLLLFDIVIGFSLAELQAPTNTFQISYNGETHVEMYNYLTHWVSQNSSQISALGITVSVIDNNSPYFDTAYFFGQPAMENVANHEDYTPGQVFAYALLFEAPYSSDGYTEDGVFYVDLQTSGSSQPFDAGIVDDLTGTLFTTNSNGEEPYWWGAEDTGVEDGYGYATGQEELNNSDDWGIVGESDEAELYITEYLNGLESVGWTVGHTTIESGAGHDIEVVKTFMQANATISNDLTDEGEPINYDTIGAYEDTRNDKIYWFVASDHHYHLILEYDLKTGAIETVFRDSGNSNTSVFNWRKNFLINDIDKVGDVLYWTSRQYGEPCSINVRKSKNSIAAVDLFDDPYILNEEGGTDDISLEDYYPYNLYDPLYPSESKRQYVEVIKRPPLHAPTYVFGSSPSIAKNELFGNLFQFRYRYVFYDNEVSAWSPISDIVRSAFDNNNVSQTNITPGVDNHLIVSVKNSSGIVKKIEVAGRKCKDLGIIGRGNRGPYAIVATLDNNFGAWQLDPDSEQTFRFFNDQAFPLVEAGEGERLYDAVPRSAHTQTILGNNRLTYGNYTEGFDVPKVAFTVTPQYGYSSAGIYGGPNYQDPVTLQTGDAVPSFKSGAFHSFGIVYYDEKGRCSTVLVDSEQKGGNSSDGRCYVKFPTERTVLADIPTGVANFDLTGAVTMKWEINHRAPLWANHYRWFYSRNNTVDEFVQFRVLQAFNNQDPASTDNRIFLNLRGLKGSDDSYITNAELDPNAVPNPDISILDYEFTKGDRVRIITSGTQIGAGVGAPADNVTTTYLDARVSGFEYYAQNDPNIPIRTNAIPSTNALNDDGSEDGWYLIIEQLIDSNGTPIANYNAASVAANTDLLEQAIVEIYKPKADPEPGEMLYFEFSELYGIDTGGRHMGPISDQGYPWTYDAFGNATSGTPAVGEFMFGDVYYKQRNMQRFANNVRGLQNFYVEDYFLNDYTDSNHINIGRANIYSAFYRQQDKEASITYSDVYQPATSFNGLSTFDYNEGNWEDYSRIDGSIQKIHYREVDIVMIQEDATYKVPVQRDILLSADGKGTVGVSNKILNPVVPFVGNYGISKNPESFVANGNVLFWTDIRRGAVLRLSGDGITPISDAKMHDYFRDREEDFRSYDPQFDWSSDYGNISGEMLTGQHQFFRIKGGFNPKHEEYIVQMDSIPAQLGHYNITEETFDVLGEWDGTGVTDQQDILVGGSVTAWRDKQKRWTSFYSHFAEYYCKVNRLFVSWDEGFLYLHDVDEENYNTFYGVTFYTELDFSINEGPSSVKGFKSLTLEANQAPEADSEGFEFEGELNTSYDVTLVTDMTETFVDRHNFDQRENKQYAQIPFVTVNSTGSEIIGLGIGSVEATDLITVVGNGTNFGAANIITGTSSDDSLITYGDQLYYNDSGNDILVGTIFSVDSSNQLTLAADSPFDFNSNFLFIKRNGYAEGDRMKGRYMEVKMRKRSRKLLEIFSGSATIFNSELSDD